MGSHILLVAQENFQKCLERGIYGGPLHPNEKFNAEIIAGLETINPGDFLFFYVKNRGVYGLWRATCRAFYDTTDIWGIKEQPYPYRICFEPVIRYFPYQIELSDILDLRDKGKIWTFDLGVIVKKSQYPITADESKELVKLLLRNNPIYHPPECIPNPYSPQNSPLPIKLEGDKKGQILYEGYLNAWFMRSFSHGGMKEIFGDYCDFLNYVPTSFNTVMDIFLTHVTKVDNVEILHKFTCIELKSGIALEKDLRQLVKYENWIAFKLANGDNRMVQSILIAFDFEDAVLDYVHKRKLIEEKTVRLMKYRIIKDENTIQLSEVAF